MSDFPVAKAADHYVQRYKLGWQPIETAPKDRSLILVWRDSGVHFAKWNVNGEFWDIWAYKKKQLKTTPPTHWRRLPNPPNAPSEEVEEFIAAAEWGRMRQTELDQKEKEALTRRDKQAHADDDPPHGPIGDARRDPTEKEPEQ